MFGGNVGRPHMPTLGGAVVIAIVIVIAYHFLAHKRRG